jgi:hypothetical protein
MSLADGMPEAAELAEDGSNAEPAKSAEELPSLCALCALCVVTVSGADWAVLACVSEQPVRRRLIRDIVTFRKAGKGYRRRTGRHVLSVSTPSAVMAELRRIGFIVRSIRAYGRFRLPYRRLAFVAKKPSAA